MKEVKETLDKAERSLQASMRKAINENNKVRRRVSRKRENSSPVRVYPISVLAHVYKKKPTLAELAKFKMAAETRQRRKKLRKLMLPTSLSKSKWNSKSTKKITRSLSLGLSLARKGRERQSVEKEVNRIEKGLDAAHNRRRKSITMMETRRNSLRLRVSRRNSTGQSKLTMPRETNDESQVSEDSNILSNLTMPREKDDESQVSEDSDILSIEDSDASY